MAGIYQADIWCDDCVNAIKKQVASDCLKRHKEGDDSGMNAIIDWSELVGDDLNALVDALDSLDERHYDSDEYPKWADDDSESDCPQHCAAGGDCLNYEELADGWKVGYFFANSLTTEGDEYVREAVIEDRERGDNGSVACTLWADAYSYIDFGSDYEDE